MTAPVHSTRNLDCDVLSYAYQSVLLADLAVMRGLSPHFRILAPPHRANRMIVASPRKSTGLQDPERRLKLAEVLQAIWEGVKRYYHDRGSQEIVTPKEIADIFLELLEMGYIVMYPQIKPTSQVTSQPHNNIINEAMDIITRNIMDAIGGGLSITEFDFKSFHGELARQAANASPLPSRYEAVGFLALPAILEPLPLSDFQGLPKEAKDWLRNQCPDKGEVLLTSLEDALRKAGYENLNRYQYQLISEYFRHRANSDKPLDVILTAPTGAGKTLAFTIIALLEILAAKCRNSQSRVVLAYPRKTLARDQVENFAKILVFLNNNLLNQGLSNPIVLWLRDGSSGVDQCRPGVADCVELPRELKPIRGITIPVVKDGTLSYDYARHRYIDRNKVYISDPSWLIDVKDDINVKINDSVGKPEDVADIIVTNYNMLFKESIDLLKGSPSPLGRVLRDARIVVLDEAHTVMGGRQSVMIQTFTLALRKANRRPGFILSSATLLERRLLQQAVSLLNVIALEVREGLSRKVSLETFRNLLGVNPSENTIYVDYYGIASQKPKGWKLTLWTIIYPSILKKPMTALNEAIVSVAHTLAAARARWNTKWNNGAHAKAIVFIEYKSSLRDVASELIRRIILESGDVYDRVLLPRLFDAHASKLKQWVRVNVTPPPDIPQTYIGGARRAHKEITDRIRKLASLGAQRGSVNVVNIIWNEDFIRFHALAPYLSISDYAGILGYQINTVSRPEVVIEDIIKNIIHNKVKDTFPSSPLSGEVWMEHMLLHAALMLKHKPWTHGDALHDYYDEIERISKSIGRNLSEFIPLVFHHGDYTGPHRHTADRLLQEANPLVILATSTLEVGLNIPGIIVTIHYILPREPGRVLQMVGRSGRHPETMRVSHGIVILRQNAWEASKRVELHAFRYFNEIRAPPTLNLIDDPYNLAQLCITLGLNDCSIFQDVVGNPNILRVADKIVMHRRGIENDILSAMRNSAPSTGIVTPECSQTLKGLLNRVVGMLGSQHENLRDALKALHMVCSINNGNHAITLAAAENAYITILDAIIQGNVPRILEKILEEVSALRSAIYLHVATVVRKIIREAMSHTGRVLSLGDIDNIIVESLIYPRGFEVPDAGDKKSPAGRVILVR